FYRFMDLYVFFQADDGIRDFHVTGVQTCALPISALHIAELVVVQTRTTNAFFIQFKTQWFYQVQTGTGIGSQPNDIARVRRNFRLKKHYVYQFAYLLKG